LTHEIVEKALLDELRLHYLHAHQIAVRAERDAVKAAGISWGGYQRFMKSHEKPIEEEKLIKVPATLDLTPYRDEKDFGLLQRLVRKEKPSRR
jgi:pyrimidine operon attenuation protein/uracil phosphoribosyltransferase